MRDVHDQGEGPAALAGPQTAEPPAAQRGSWHDLTEHPEELSRRYERMVSSVQVVPELSMRMALVARELKAMEPEEAVWTLDQLIRGALWGHQPEIDAMFACANWLIRARLDDDYYALQTLFEAAHDAARPAVLALCRDVPPHMSLPRGKRLPEVRLPMTREVTLGERRTIASAGNRQMLERLIYDPSPLVIAKLLVNPQVRRQEVVLIAARRPTTPDILTEVALSQRWMSVQMVREALCLNPYAPTGMALKLLPTLGLKTLRMVAYAEDLHPLVHESARLLVALREERTAPWRV